MPTTLPAHSWRTVAIALTALAVAMGVGRFAFTPMLPLMQADSALSLSQASYLASSNYAGYLFGALLCTLLGLLPARLARIGLVGVALTTLGMALTSLFVHWLALRFLAGVASALVLVGVSAWVLGRSQGVPAVAGWVFAGVGIGIALAGVSAIVVALTNSHSAAGWLWFGLTAAVVALVACHFMTDQPRPVTAAPVAAIASATHREWRVVLCYGVFGFGYIIPATYLPAAARALIDDALWFGWMWPLFGIAAAISTILATTLPALAPRRLWTTAQVAMAMGVALPALHLSLACLAISALLVGGTFMLITMAGMQEARRVCRDASPARLMAKMTAAFALGQMLGPLSVALAGTAVEAMRAPCLLAGVLLLLATLLLRRADTAPATAYIYPSIRARARSAEPHPPTCRTDRLSKNAVGPTLRL